MLNHTMNASKKPMHSKNTDSGYIYVAGAVENDNQQQNLASNRIQAIDFQNESSMTPFEIALDRAQICKSVNSSAGHKCQSTF